MKITRFSIDHSMSVYVLIACIVIGGLISYVGLPREAAPDIPIPVVIVSTPYFGVSPTDIETLVTQPLEKQFKGLRNLKVMTSTSAESVSLITLEFEPDVDIDEALQRIRAQVDKAKPDLPADAEDPDIIEINTSDWPILVANISGDLDPLRLKELGEQIQDDLENIKGVLRVNLAGGVEREIQINVDPEKLLHHGVSLNDVVIAVQTENINLPGGSLDIGSMKYIVRVAGEFKDMETIENIVVKSPEGEPIYLRDVARVEDGFKERATYSRLTTWVNQPDGTRRLESRPNVSLAVVKRSGENIISIADEAKELIARYDRAAGEGVNITIVNDMSDNIRAIVHELENNIISGLLLVLGVLFFFMGGARNALFVAVSVPLSMLITFLVLSMMGITLNMVVLFALLMALGMLVDNAIVIVENIYRHASEGKDRVQAAYDGTVEVGWAIIASTATTVAAFFPLLFWPGIMGKFMGFLPMTVIITLISSLFVALVINPTLCARMLKVKEGVTFSESSFPDNLLYRAYRATLVGALNHRVFVIILAIVAFMGTIAVFGKNSQGVEFFPQTTPEQFNVVLQMPDGTNLEATNELLTELETYLDRAPELVTAWITDAGVSGGGQASGGGEASHYGQISVELLSVEDQTSNPLAFMEDLRKLYARIPGASIVLDRQNMGPPGGAPVNIEIEGEDLAELGRLAREIRERIRGIEGIIDLKDNIELSRPEIHVEVDRQRAALVGLSTQSIAQTVRTAINGNQASVFREGDEEYDITVRLPQDRRRDIMDIEQLRVVNNDGFHIPLTEVARVKVLGGSGSIRHKDQERVVTVSANNAEGFLPANLLKEVQAKIADLQIPAGYQIRYTGEQEDQAEAGAFLSKALLSALFLILLILVTQFNSLIQPMIILASVLLSLIGVLWSLVLNNEPFGIIMTGIGIISLAGVVVNNAIVMIDYINKLRERGLERREAVIQAGLVRFRPVMLTAITTVLGLLPLVLGVSIDFVNRRIVMGGNSVEMWGPMARAISSGLVVATLLTLIVVPVLYSFFDELSELSKHLVLRATGVAALFAMFLTVSMVIPMIGHAQEAPAQKQEQEQEQEQEAPGLDLPLPKDSPLRGDRDVDKDHLGLEAKRTITLEEARERVRQQNYDVQIARTRIEHADGVIRQAWGAVYPRFIAAGAYTINQEEIAVSLGGDDLPPGAEAPEFIVQPRTDYNWSLSASVNMNFRSYPMIRRAYAQRELAVVQVEALRENLDFAVIQTYYNLLSMRRMVDLAAQQLASARTLLLATEARRAAGVADEFELTRSQLRAIQTEKALERSRMQFIQVREVLAELLQTEADFDISTPPDVQVPPDPEILREQARQARASLAVEALNREVAQLTVTEVYYQYLPALSATFRYFGSRGTALSPGDPRWMLTLGAEWLLWDGGMREAQIRQAQAQLAAAEIQQRRADHQLVSSIDQAWAEYRTALTQVEAGQTEIELAERGLSQAQTAYRHGVATQLDVLNAQDQLEIAQLSHLQDRLQLELSIQRVKTLTNFQNGKR